MHRSIPTLAAALTAALAVAACDRPTTPEQGSEAKGTAMKSAKGFVGNIEAMTEQNTDFRRVVYTAPHEQLVVMALPPREHIGAEVHDVDQFFRVEAGAGQVVIDQETTAIGPGSAIVIPAGTKHDIINTGPKPLKLYTLYSPPHHRDGVVHHSRADAEKDTEHFDGKTTL
jgi:mannose-6-phosphate isomerase-like protein (cupin superfamily)